MNMVRAFHALIALAALTLLACVIFIYGPWGSLGGFGAAVLLAYPAWDRERARLHEEAEKKYRGHAYASAQALGTRARELALEFADHTQRASIALAAEAARLRQDATLERIEVQRPRPRIVVIDGDAAD